jgi:nitrate reductase delta subunit
MAQLPNPAIALRVLARLLAYPDAALRADLADMRAALRADGALCADRKGALYFLMHRLESGDALKAESDFVELFDRGRSTSLHLFEHVHGDSRDRGPAMIDLAQTYEKAGLFLAAGELPDYLPVLLEFASTQTPQLARAFLGEMAHLLNAIFNALQKRQSPYAAVLGALLDLCGEPARAVAIDPDEAIDAAWEEPIVFDGCTAKGQGKSTQEITFVKPLSSKGLGAASTGASR